jgi:hypothetical protein
MRALSTWLALALIACGGASTYLTVVKGPDGKLWYTIRCAHREACLERAGNECPDGYESAGDSQEQEGYVSGRFNHGTGYISGSSETDTIMMIRCRGTSAAAIEARAEAKRRALRPACGQDFQAHGCQGSTRWVEETRSCEPCSE